MIHYSALYTSLIVIITVFSANLAPVRLSVALNALQAIFIVLRILFPLKFGSSKNSSDLSFEYLLLFLSQYRTSTTISVAGASFCVAVGAPAMKKTTGCATVAFFASWTFEHDGSFMLWMVIADLSADGPPS